VTAGHLVHRFVGSLSPRAPSAAEVAWAESHLLVEEAELWRRMGRVDRRHVLGVARRVEAALGTGATRPVLAAALLHDIGKLESHLSTYGRVVATLSIKVAGPVVAEAWTQTRGFTRRVGLYAQHEHLGAEMLELAGSDPVTVALVREHSRPEPDRTAPAHLAAALRAADDA
jgi:putative nucleotidyltransferase with HDIG domain